MSSVQDRAHARAVAGSMLQCKVLIDPTAGGVHWTVLQQRYRGPNKHITVIDKGYVPLTTDRTLRQCWELAVSSAWQGIPDLPA